MGINIKNYLTRLGIETGNAKQTLEELTNQEVEELYADRLVDIYISLQKDHSNIEEEKWEEREDELKEELYRQIRKMPPKAKIIILENKIDETEMSREEKESLKIRKENYKVAYEALNTEEGRREYIWSLRKQKQFERELEELIKKEGEEPQEELVTQLFSKGNSVEKVEEEDMQMPQYNVEYKDADITLCYLASIKFHNGQFQDRFRKYILFLADEQTHITPGYEFYGEIEKEKMHDSHYRVALYQAVRQHMLEGKNYIGFIGKNENGFYIRKDYAQELAVSQYEKQQKEKMIGLSKQRGR